MTAIVTGANRGIGLGVTGQLAERGYRVILAVRDEARGRAAAERIGAAQERPEVRNADVSDEPFDRRGRGLGRPRGGDR